MPESKFFIRRLTDKLDVDLTERMEHEKRKINKWNLRYADVQCHIVPKMKQSSSLLLFNVSTLWISHCGGVVFLLYELFFMSEKEI